MFNNPGFTAENLMQDMRYRIQNALNEAGLSGSSYARQVINQIPLGNKDRRDMHSNIALI